MSFRGRGRGRGGGGRGGGRSYDEGPPDSVVKIGKVCCLFLINTGHCELNSIVVKRSIENTTLLSLKASLLKSEMLLS